MNKNVLMLIGWSILMFGAGAGFGYWNWAPRQVVETAAPAVAIAPSPSAPHGGMVAERKVDPKAVPKQRVPAGTRPERVISADITPIEQAAADKAAAPCPKVHIDATVVRDADGAGRVLISSPDGYASNATDTVIQSLSTVSVHPWAIGPAYSTRKSLGIWATRDFGRIRAGLMATQSQPDTTGHRDYEGWALIGINFGG